MPKDRTLLSPDQIAELLEVCVRFTYFSYKAKFYEQKEDPTMSSLVPAVVANLYMDFS